LPEKKGETMEVFNRVLVTLLLIVLCATLIWAMLQPLQIVEALRLTANGLEDVMYSNYFLYLGIAAAALFVVLVLFWLEVRRRARKTVKVYQVSTGDVELSVSSIGQSLVHYIDGLSGVVKVRPRIISRGKALDVVLNVETRPDVDVPAKTSEICQVARDVVEGKLGLHLRKIQANIKYAPYPRGAEPVGAAAATITPFAMPERTPYVAPVKSVPTDPFAHIPMEEQVEEEEPAGPEEFVLPPLEEDDDLS
jgi:hypothetical protein